MVRVAAILLLLGITHTFADPLIVKFNLTCTLENTVKTDWCGNLTVYEYDSVSANDILKTLDFCFFAPKLTFDFKRSPGGDNSPNYEINYSISHNCTTEGTVKCLHPYHPKVVPTSGEQVVVFEQELFHVGETGKCKPIA